jgi:hypothetical protein
MRVQWFQLLHMEPTCCQGWESEVFTDSVLLSSPSPWTLLTYPITSHLDSSDSLLPPAAARGSIHAS